MAVAKTQLGTASWQQLSEWGYSGDGTYIAALNGNVRMIYSEELTDNGDIWTTLYCWVNDIYNPNARSIAQRPSQFGSGTLVSGGHHIYENAGFLPVLIKTDT